MKSSHRSLFEKMDPTIRDSAHIKEENEQKKRKALLTKALRANQTAMRIVVASEDRWMDLVKETLFNELMTRARESEGASANGAKDLMESIRVSVIF
jgi:hypothetical protein